MRETKITRAENGRNFPGKVVDDITKCEKRACIFKWTKKQNKVDPPEGLEIGIIHITKINSID